MQKFRFSLVTTCRNEMKSVVRWKQNLLEQTRPPDEIVIVDAFSDDGTAEFLSEWAVADNRVKFFQEKGAAAHGRNVAIEQASFEYLLSTDMGVRLSDNWCEELITPFEEDPGIEVVAGNTCIDIDTVKTAVARAEYYVEKGGFAKLEPGFVPGNRSVAYTKKVWRELEGLPEDLTFYADDSVFGRQMLQAGYKMAYAPKAMTYWGRPQKLKQFWQEQYLYGIGHGEADIKIPRAFKWYMSGYLPRILVPYIMAIRFLQKQVSLAAIMKAINQKDWKALFIMPVLLLGNGYYLASGHLIGYDHGLNNCMLCRKRLKDEYRV